MQTSSAHLQGRKKQLPRLWYALVVLVVLFMLPVTQTWAKTYRILIVSSSDGPVYTQIISTIQETVASQNEIKTTFNTLLLQDELSTDKFQKRVNKQDLILTIGQRAMKATTRLKNSPPIITSLIPKDSYEKYRRALHRVSKKTTAVFIDNPPETQILLAKILLGRLQRLGVLISENPPYSKTRIKAAIQASGIKSYVYRVKNTDNVIRILSKLLENSDALLALPDAQIFNRSTVQNILLTTYRHRIPVIAYSASYVKAGALAAVYSTPQQNAEHIGKILLNILSSRLSFPTNDTHPEDFDIAINQSVASSLGIPVLSPPEIKNKLLNELRGRK